MQIKILVQNMDNVNIMYFDLVLGLVNTHDVGILVQIHYIQLIPFIIVILHLTEVEIIDISFNPGFHS